MFIYATCWSFMQRSISIDGSVIRTTDSVHDLGFILRADISIHDQISTVVHSCYYYFKQLYSFRASLTHDVLQDAAYALPVVIACIDCCNRLYLNLSEVLIRCLYMLVNAVVQFISGRSLFCHITDFVRNDLQWLPVKRQIQFNVSTLVYKSLHDCGPANIENLVCHSTLATCQSGLWSSITMAKSNRSQIPEQVCWVGFWSHRFSYMEQLAWSYSFGTFTCNFYKLLKVHLFRITYN